MTKTSAGRPRTRRKSQTHTDPKPGLAARLAAQRLLGAIVDAHTPMDALTDDMHGHPHYLALEPRDRALVRAILMAALRRRGDLEAVLASLADRPLPTAAISLRALMHVALAQVLFLDVPDHSAVDLAVEAARADPRNRRFAGLVNAVTRRAVREKQRLLARIERDPARAPQWFVERLDAIHGVELARIIESRHRQSAPIDVTLKDESAVSVAHWAEALDAGVLPTGSLRLRSRAAIVDLPGFADGAWWVQDAAAAIPARLFGDCRGKRVLDLCAAPGGKTAQLAARGAHVTALDISKSRIKRLAANLERLGLAGDVTTVTASLFDYAPDAPFDAVLLDAPCSSTGTVRRHPDVPWTKTDADIVKLADLQARMLERATAFVAPGGTLVFSNCSLDPREGEDVARDFAHRRSDFAALPIVAEEAPGLSGGLTGDGLLRTTPADWPDQDGLPGGVDGFFVGRFVRKA